MKFKVEKVIGSLNYYVKVIKIIENYLYHNH